MFTHFPPSLFWDRSCRVMPSTNLSLVLVAPLWPQKEWCADLLAFLVEEPLKLPLLWKLLFQPHVRKFHRGLEMLYLHSWKLSSDFICKAAEAVSSDLRRFTACLYQEKWSRCLTTIMLGHCCVDSSSSCICRGSWRYLSLLLRVIELPFSPSMTGGTVCTLQTQMVSGPASTTFLPQKKFWIIALLGQYSIVSHVFPWAASFLTSVNAMEENKGSWEGGRLAYFWHWCSKKFYYYY